MIDKTGPTETYDGRITVRLLRDKGDNESISCHSIEESIKVLKQNEHSVTTAKIIDQDGDVVFSSIDTSIEDWETVWKREKRRLSVSVEEHDCPYNNIACVSDDLCVKCKMDKAQRESK